MWEVLCQEIVDVRYAHRWLAPTGDSVSRSSSRRDLGGDGSCLPECHLL